jgi:hypothetical protein
MTLNLYDFANLDRVTRPLLEAEAGRAAQPAPVAQVAGQERTPAALTQFVRVRLRARSTPEWRQLSAIYFPPAVNRSSRSIDIILYLHGHRTSIPGERSSIWTYLKHKCWPLREHLAATRKAAVLVAPTLGPQSQSGTLLAPGGLDRYLEGVLAASRGYWQSGVAPEIRHLILAGHSGAGAPMRALANSQNRAAALLKEVWGFDCTYSAKHDADAVEWTQWARSAPQSHLYIYYLRGAPTRQQAVKLRDRAKLPNVSVLESNATVRERIHPHYWVPIQHWSDRITASPHLR